MTRFAEAYDRIAVQRRIDAQVRESLGTDVQPLAWCLTMLGFEGYSMRVWFEPIEDEL